MYGDDYKDLEFQVNKVFEDLGGSLVNGPDREKDMNHLMCNPFFITRNGEVPRSEGRDGMMVSIRPHFTLGIILGTLKFKSTVDPDEALVALSRHANRDWGNLCKEDKEANEKALRTGQRILSAYSTRQGLEFWIITEDDRSVTTALLPEEYEG